MIRKIFLISLMMFCSSLSNADTYDENWGPMIGRTLPILDASDHAGAARRFDDLVGDDGLLLFMNRSADW